MARSFDNFGQIPYRGLPVLTPIKFRGIAGQAVALTFNWTALGAASATPNINVLINLETALISQKLDAIRSVYIDNMGSDVPIYVNCPDTSYAVVAKPNSAGWYPIYTNQMKLEIVGLGFIDNDIPVTRVLVTNLTIDPSIDDELTSAVALWRASRTISRGNTIYNSDLGIPALGDQTVQPSVALGSLNTTLIFPVQTSGFWYINSYYAYTTGINNNITKFLSVQWESTGVAGTLFVFPFTGVNATTFPNSLMPICVATQNGMNLKLDATQTWQLRNTDTLLSGGFFCIIAYTYNPN